MPSAKEINYIVDTTNNLSDLQTVPNLTKITIRIKVVDIMGTFEVKPGLMKQDVLISDDTGTATLTLWQQNIGSLEDGKSYILQGVSVREFNNSKYLSFLNSSII